MGCYICVTNSATSTPMIIEMDEHCGHVTSRLFFCPLNESQVYKKAFAGPTGFW